MRGTLSRRLPEARSVCGGWIGISIFASHLIGIRAPNPILRTSLSFELLHDFLLVIDPAVKESKESLIRQINASMKEDLESLIEKGISDGIPVDYYIAYGQYESELVEFVKENRITMLVVGSPTPKDGFLENFDDLLQKIRHRIDCRIEVVHEKIVRKTEKRRG